METRPSKVETFVTSRKKFVTILEMIYGFTLLDSPRCLQTDFRRETFLGDRLRQIQDQDKSPL
jgi:hypothetical protein